MNKVPARPKINKLKKQVPGTINKYKIQKYNLESSWSDLGGHLGGHLGSDLGSDLGKITYP